MKNKLNADNLNSVNYYNGIYELEFYEDGQQIIIRNVREQDHPNAAIDEWYFDGNEIIEEIIKNAEDEDIEIKEKKSRSKGFNL